ncbi:MAG: glycogen/starch/alpha-glucan phosphorylase [Planctomycetes bacterium]|nr:glycogen/starch/alpha-glucan phosphorylase [Planctomycetota bacterium]
MELDPTSPTPPDTGQLASSLRHHLRYHLARSVRRSTKYEVFLALARAVREPLTDRWLATERTYRERNVRRTCYLSMEFLLGRLLRNAVYALEAEEPCSQVLRDLGHRLEDIEEQEDAAGLGSGGLGRLAACFLDSAATHELPVWGYGLRYQYGLFRQFIVDGYQVEEPDHWLARENPWEVCRPDDAVIVSFYGGVTVSQDGKGGLHYRWVGTEDVLATPYDIPIPGYGTNTVNTLRLWSASSPNSGVDLHTFQQGDFQAACQRKFRAETITAVLYPGERSEAGKELRLRQQFLLASATLQDIIRRHLHINPDLRNLDEKASIQLNDTHPTLAVPELMRLLMDQHGFGWDDAWQLTSRVFAYTNHTLMPEALERWPFHILARLLPRHVQIIQEVDRRFLEQVRRVFPGEEERAHRMAIIDPGLDRQVRMANLAVVGSSSVNGVAALHTELLKTGLLSDFYAMFPQRFNNKTNGITPRRWLNQANPRLAALVSSRIGRGWVRDLDELQRIEPLAEDPEFRRAWREVKQKNKVELAKVIDRHARVEVDPTSMFDAQIKRIHEYKRQLMLALEVIHEYQALLRDPDRDVLPRTVIVAGKAAVDYAMAKLVIKLINSAGAVINTDPRVRGRLKVVFLPNYRVTLAQHIVAGSDVSEQISTAGYEASGTGNMKFALNGALTLGTLDGANVEIAQAVGDDNIVIFGLQAHEVREWKQRGYRPREIYERDPGLREVLDAVAGEAFSLGRPGLFRPIVDSLLHHDEYMVLADFAAYVQAHQRVARLYRDPEAWTRASILNTARVGRFSSDRTIHEYARDIWRVEPQAVALEPSSEAVSAPR